MEYLYLVWYVLLLCVDGYTLWCILKQNGTGTYSKKDVAEYEKAMENHYGKKKYLVMKIIGGILLTLFWLYMLGKCAQEYLKI